MPQPAAPSGGASGQPLSWPPGRGRAPAPTSPRADPVSGSWFLCASCLRKRPWKTQTHDPWVDKYASVSLGGGRGEAGKRETITGGPIGPGQGPQPALHTCARVQKSCACVCVWPACMTACACALHVGRAMEPHSQLWCGSGLQASDPPPVRGWRQAQQGEGGAHQARGEPACPQQCWAPHVLLTLMHELLPQREPEETGGGGERGERGARQHLGRGCALRRKRNSSAKLQQLIEGLRSQSPGPGEAQWCFSSLKLLECSLGCLQSGFPFSWDPGQDLVFVSRL